MTKKDDRSRTGANTAPAVSVEQDNLEAFEVEEEHRSADRDMDVCVGISSFTMMKDGSYLEGVVKDVSDGGARITGEVQGLSVGQNVDLGLVIQGEKIRYSCVIAHIEPDAKTYGLRFVSGPTPVAPEVPEARRCIKCRREYAPEWNFCGICGSELTRPRTI